MAMLFILVLSGATLWGVLNILRKHFLTNKDHEIDPWTMIVGTMLSASIVAVIWQFAYYGMPTVTHGFWIPLAITIILSIAIESAEVFAFKMEDASLVGAIMGLTPLFVLFTSWIILKEFPTPFGLVGILSIVAGFYLFRRKSGSWSRLFSSKGAQLAFLAAIAGSVALNTAKLTVLASSPGTQVGATWLAVSLVVFAFTKATGKWKGINKDFYIACAIGVLLGIMEVMFSSAYLFGIVPYVGSLKRFQIVVTALLAVIFLKEPQGKNKIMAAAIIFAGIVLIAF